MPEELIEGVVELAGDLLEDGVELAGGILEVGAEIGVELLAHTTSLSSTANNPPPPTVIDLGDITHAPPRTAATPPGS